jgi:precorrin-2/cobalt-factor-2 C20-methyltransferase
MRLIGVGMGPGDPELVTVKAVRVLREADVVLVPVMETGETGRAEATVRHHLGDDSRIRRVVFALNDRGGVTRRRAAAWDRAAQAVREAFEAGADTVAFATIGDPNVYSTFTYLAQTVREVVPGLAVETVPGITAMQDLAARSGTVLAEGDETVSLVPAVGDPGVLVGGMAYSDTVVFYKCGRHLDLVRQVIEEEGRLHGAVFGAQLGLPYEDIRPLAEVETATAPYLSTVIVPARRTGRGGRL